MKEIKQKKKSNFKVILTLKALEKQTPEEVERIIGEALQNKFFYGKVEAK